MALLLHRDFRRKEMRAYLQKSHTLSGHTSLIVVPIRNNQERKLHLKRNAAHYAESSGDAPGSAFSSGC
ncbi:hypothetical protein BGAL_0308g00060 [Botrytis galanthina]|uniref:Uncharacterized protein n=1 Tax=Botrytis galanthina TaxID=278940 RepID=A0A4S8R0G1_9HELO|nr:hypothetical protein BGAL_0308g00060 [Botrytis galanthina]